MPASEKELDFGDDVDQQTFDQILEMDDEDDDSRDFSSGIVFDFLTQAQTTFERMQESIEAGNLDDLSGQGHFLKGSSATLGFIHIRDACEKIQHYGHLKREDGNGSIDKDTALKLIKSSLEDATDAYARVAILMRKFFGRSSD